MDKFIIRKRRDIDGKTTNISVPNEVLSTVGGPLEEDLVEQTELSDESSKVLLLANMDPNKDEVQRIQFATSLLSENYRLLEVSPDLADRIQSGEALIFRGKVDDNPVLCTRSQTFQVKEVETSDSFLVTTKLNFESKEVASKVVTEQEVITVKTHYLEMKQLETVSTVRLKELLNENQLRWDSDSCMKNWEKLYSFNELLDVVQMSEDQLQSAIERMPVIIIRGKLLKLSMEYCDRLLMILTDLIDDEDVEFTASFIHLDTFTETFMMKSSNKSIPVEAIQWLVRTYCVVNTDFGVENGIYKLNERAVCRSKASQLLRAAVKYDYSSFENALFHMLPIGIVFKEDYLNGMAFINEDPVVGKIIRYLNVDDLPGDERKRMEILFSLRSKWRGDDIKHFLTDLCPTTLSLNLLLDKYCRSGQDNDEFLYVGLK